MRFSYPTKRIDSLESFSRSQTWALGGYFPIGSSLTWHGGIHVETEEPIACIADGTIVAYRFSEKYKEYMQDEKPVPFSNNFVLVQHHYKSPNGQELVFYSLYQHLRPKNGGEFAVIPPFLSQKAEDGTIIWNSDAVSEDVKNCNIPVKAGEILGYGGYSGVGGEKNPELVHLEVFTAKADKEALDSFIRNDKKDGISGENRDRISSPHAFLPTKLRESFPCRLLGDTQITDVNDWNDDYYRIKIGSVRRRVDWSEVGGRDEQGRHNFTNDWNNPGFRALRNTTVFGGLPQEGDFIRLLETQAEIDKKRAEGDTSRLVEFSYPNITGRTFFIEKKYLKKIEIEVPDDPIVIKNFRTCGPWLYESELPISKVVSPSKVVVQRTRTETHYRLSADGTSVVVQDLHLRTPSDSRETDVGENSVVVEITPENTIMPPEDKPWYYKRPSYVYNNARERKRVEGYFQVDANRLFPAHNWHNFGFRISEIEQDKYRMDLENPSPLLQKVWSIIKKKDDEEMISSFWFKNRLADDRHMFTLSRHIFLHRSDWAYTTEKDIADFEKEWRDAMNDYIQKKAKTAASKNFLESKRDEQLPKLTNLAKELSFWDKIEIDTEHNPDLTAFPDSPYVYHFHPIAFIEQMKRMQGGYRIGDKGKAVLELNIRLAGFGGLLPTEEFTELTEKGVKQFQRDYMKMARPTGEADWDTLEEIDEFCEKYKFTFSELECKCSTKGQDTRDVLLNETVRNNCNGFGDGSNRNTRFYERPGVHRSLLFVLKALMFYLEKDKSQFSLRSINSGYRCRFHSVFMDRRTTNHMGTALDLHFNNKDGVRTRDSSDMDAIRKYFICKYMNAPLTTIDGTGRTREFGWKRNHIGLEPKRDSRGRDGATSWVHVDVREFETKYQDDKFFVKNESDVIGKPIIEINNE